MLQDSAKQVPSYFLDCSLLRNQRRNPSSDLWDPLWLEATRNAEKGLWALLFLHNHWNVSGFGTFWSLKWKLIPLELLSCKLPSLLCFFFRISGMRYIMNGTLIFLLGTPNNNLGPVTLASPPWTSCASQPPNMLVKNLNLLNFPLKFQPLGKWSRPCST